MSYETLEIEKDLYHKLLIKSLPNPPLPNKKIEEAVAFAGNQHNPGASWKTSFTSNLEIDDLEHLHMSVDNSGLVFPEAIVKILNKYKEREPFQIRLHTYILEGESLATQAIDINPDESKYTSNAFTLNKIFEKNGDRYRLEGLIQFNIDKIK